MKNLHLIWFPEGNQPDVSRNKLKWVESKVNVWSFCTWCVAIFKEVHCCFGFFTNSNTHTGTSQLQSNLISVRFRLKCCVEVPVVWQETFQTCNSGGVTRSDMGAVRRIPSKHPKIQWRQFWLATQLYPPQNDQTGWQNGVNNDVIAQSPVPVRQWPWKMIPQSTPLWKTIRNSILVAPNFYLPDE